MADIFDEVTEDLRRQQFLKAWRNYGKFLMAAVALVIVGVAAYELQKYYQDTKSHKDSSAFAEALALLDSGQPDDGLAALARLQESGGSGYSFLAGVREGRTLRGLGDQDGAIRVFERLAADTGYEKPLRDYAELQAVVLSFDGAAPGSLKDRLERLAAPGAAWAPQAEELLALDEIRAGEFVVARERLDRLRANTDAPGGIRLRAEQLLATLPRAPSAAENNNAE